MIVTKAARKSLSASEEIKTRPSESASTIQSSATCPLNRMYDDELDVFELELGATM
jgi:hypothetical protein